MAGTKPKLCEELIKAITDQMALGLSLEDAAVLCDVSKRQAWFWQSKGLEADAKPLHRRFAQAVEKARSARKQRWLAVIERAGKAKKDGGEGQWTAAAWKLERTDPAQFAQRLRVELDREFSQAIERLQQEFANEPAILLRACAAIAGEQGQGAGAVAPGGATGPDDRSREAVQPPPPKPSAGGLPSP